MAGSDLEYQLRESQRCVIDRDGAAADSVLDRDFARVLVRACSREALFDG